MKSEELIERIFEHLENDATEKAVMSCLRLARRHKDYFNSIIFLRELYPNKDQIQDVFFDETQGLKKEACTYLWEKTLEKWLEEHSVDLLNTEEKDSNERRNILAMGIGELEGECKQLEKMIDDLTLPQGMGEFDTAAFTDRYNDQKITIRNKIRGIATVRQRIRTRCLNYAIRLEKQLSNQVLSRNYVIEAQNTVNNYFSEASPDVYKKLQKAAQLQASNNSEDYSLLLTSVRRVLNAVADHFFPPQDKPYICSDEKERVMGSERYLNRLEEFIRGNFGKSRSAELLSEEIKCLASFSRKLNDLASKGVHSNVNTQEAKQCFIGLYMFLYNLIAKLQYENVPE